jgi:hypothetical protein
MDGELALDQPLPSKTATDKVSILPQAEIVENPVRQFSKAAREALITRGCTIIQVGDSGLTVEQKKDRLRGMSSGLINDQEIERLLFSWPENSEYAILPEVALEGSNNKTFSESTEQLDEYASKFEQEVPGVSLKKGTVAEYVGIMHSQAKEKKPNPWDGVFVRTETIFQDWKGNDRNCFIIDGFIDIADPEYKDENFKMVPLISPTT